MAEKPTILAVRAVSPAALKQSKDLVARKLAGAKVSTVREWQQKWNAKHPDAKIQVDGKVGQQTLSAMRSGSYRAVPRPAGSSRAVSSSSSRYGEKGASPLVIGLRRASNAMGGNPDRPSPYGSKGESPLTIGLRRASKVLGEDKPRPAPRKPKHSKGIWGRWTSRH